MTKKGVPTWNQSVCSRRGRIRPMCQRTLLRMALPKTQFQLTHTPQKQAQRYIWALFTRFQLQFYSKTRIIGLLPIRCGNHQLSKIEKVYQSNTMRAKSSSTKSFCWAKPHRNRKSWIRCRVKTWSWNRSSLTGCRDGSMLNTFTRRWIEHITRLKISPGRLKC